MYHTGAYIRGQSFVYNLDARLKLAATIFFSFFILWVKPPTALLAGTAIFCTAAMSGISFRIIWQAVRPLLFFIFLIFAAHVLFPEDSARNFWPGLFAGLKTGFIVVWRFLSLIVAGVLLTMTTAPSQMIAALKFFLKPLRKLRVPVDEIALMIMLALRLMPVLLAEKERIETARKARGYDARKSGFVKNANQFLLLSLKILLGVFRRADELALAMDARNYRRGERSSFVELKFKPADYFTFVALSFSLILFAVLNSRIS